MKKKYLYYFLFFIIIIIFIIFYFYKKNTRYRNNDSYKIITHYVKENYDKDKKEQQEMIDLIYDYVDLNYDLDESLIINLIEENYIVKIINEQFISEEDMYTDLSNWKFNLKTLKENYDLLSSDPNIILYYVDSYIQGYEIVEMSED